MKQSSPIKKVNKAIKPDKILGLVFFKNKVFQEIQ